MAQLFGPKKQTAGHGKSNRIWRTGKGNLAFSIIIKNFETIENIAIYPFLAALSIKDSLTSYTNNNTISFKWPNDILLNGKKTAGILFESFIEKGKITKIICGIGINIANSPKELKSSTSTIEEDIQDIEIAPLLFSIVENLDKYFQILEKKQHQHIYDLWTDSAYYLGKEISVINGETKLTGIFKGIEQGNLLLEIKNKITKISTGDICFANEERINILD